MSESKSRVSRDYLMLAYSVYAYTLCSVCHMCMSSCQLENIIVSHKNISWDIDILVYRHSCYCNICSMNATCVGRLSSARRLSGMGIKQDRRKFRYI